MTLAFQATQEDVALVLRRYRIVPSEETLEKIFDDHILERDAEIEKAAMDADLTGDDDESILACQTEAAHEKIAEILTGAGIIPKQ